VLVTADGMPNSAATLRLFQRKAATAPWREIAAPAPARIGRAGLAWGEGFHRLQRPGEPRKIEGDQRSPAGVYRIGRSFGRDASSRANYLQLTPQTVCVDDPASPGYNSITRQAALASGTHVERMHAIPHYRAGLVVDYPTDRAARAGSCVFIHVWRSPATPTSGCVAVSEARVRALQRFAAAGAVIAILPRDALRRMPGCLPGSIGDAVN
jgi:L,D-peptidoglycan transpeptidase YkuD (ErfK/YbiS/YcfS/YnhG family)